MAHYAFLDDENIVVEVIVGKDETELLDGLTPEEWYSDYRSLKCVRTSFNGKIRKNFAGLGYFYDEDLDAFIAPKCHDEAVLDEDSCQWVCANLEHEVINDREVM